MAEGLTRGVDYTDRNTVVCVLPQTQQERAVRSGNSVFTPVMKFSFPMFHVPLLLNMCSRMLINIHMGTKSDPQARREYAIGLGTVFAIHPDLTLCSKLLFHSLRFLFL